jgi:hypothetical protein
MKRVAISQSNYIPWKGYFDMIALVDEFVLFDDMQFTRRDWRNRNQIKTATGAQWLTIPVSTKGKYFDAIKDISIKDSNWAEDHWKAIRLSYAKAPHFSELSTTIADLYQAAAKETLLSRVNFTFLRGLCEILGIKTRITWSMDYLITTGKTERLASICTQSGATHYLSGPAAKTYLDPSIFADIDIQVEWMDYSWYPPYEQRFGEFTHGLSVLDVLFNCGSRSPEFVWKRPV